MYDMVKYARIVRIVFIYCYVVILFTVDADFIFRGVIMCVRLGMYTARILCQ